MSGANQRDGWILREPTAEDGAALWALVQEAGTLDLNSAYQYILWADLFSDTSVVAAQGGRIGGFVTGFRPPREPSALFIWQVGVAPQARGAGLASRMLDQLWERTRPRARTMLTTVSPSNTASRRLFASFALRHGLSLVEEPGYTSSLFPGGASLHEDEPLLRLTSAGSASL